MNDAPTTAPTTSTTLPRRRMGLANEQISAIGLGCNTFGAACDREDSARVVHAAIDLGINFFDTAEAYSSGVSEEFLGEALKNRRSQVVVATKTGVVTDPTPRLTRKKIIQRLEASLRRLRSDYVDVYYLHFPDPTTPLEESLEALDALVRAGKVLFPAMSNYPGSQVTAALARSEEAGWAKPVVSQSLFNLMDRSVEADLVPALEHAGMSLVAHSALAGGFLTGKYQRGAAPAPGTRGYADPNNTNVTVVGGKRWQDRWLTEANFDKLHHYEKVAHGLGWSVSEVAISWILSHPVVCSVIAGARTPQQVAANVKAGSLVMPNDAIDALTELA